jgi:hypothetical protein
VDNKTICACGRSDCSAGCQPVDSRQLWRMDMGLDGTARNQAELDAWADLNQPAFPIEAPPDGPVGLPPFLAAVQAQVADMQARVDQALGQLTPAARPDWRDLLSPRHQVMLQAAVQLDTQFQAAGWPGAGQAALIRSMADILDGLV